MRGAVNPRRPLLQAATLGVACGALAVVAAALATGAATPRAAPLLTGLAFPRGLSALPGGHVLLAEVSGRLSLITPRGDLAVVAGGLPSGQGGPASRYPIGPSAAVASEDDYYFIVGESRGKEFSTLYRLRPGERPEAVAGGVAETGFPSTPLTNPYDMVPAPGGGFLVTDSGRNAVLRVRRSGEVSVYASFPRRPTPQSARLAERFETMDVVPTGLASGPKGVAYLASLTGFPYPRGAARVYRLEDRNGDGDALDEGETTVHATGFSAATDVAVAPDGSLLVTEFSTDMLALVQEHGVDNAARAPGRLVRWREGEIQVVARGMISPSSVTVAGGRILVSEEFAGRVTAIDPEGRLLAFSPLWPWPAAAGGAVAALAAVARLAWPFRAGRKGGQGQTSSRLEGRRPLGRTGPVAGHRWTPQVPCRQPSEAVGR